MGGCSVLHCQNRFVAGSKHFFRFPKDQWRMEKWIKFTQKKNFIPKTSSTICEDHFKSENLIKKKDRTKLSKEAVPTIIYKNGSRFDIRFDENLKNYIDDDFQALMEAEVTKIYDNPAPIDVKQARIDDFKTVCRICLTHDEKRVPIEKLESVNSDELMTHLGINTHYNDFFSSFLCETCFTQISELDTFVRKVRDAQLEAINEIQEFQSKITDLDVSTSDKQYELLEEEHLIDEEFIDEQVEYIEEMPEDVIESSENILIEQSYEESLEEEHQISVQGVDEYEMISTEDIIKNPDRNRFCFKIYECFFCKMKFAGRKTFVAHKCPITEIQCEMCSKKFQKLQAYNSHLAHVHDSLPIENHCCPICKTVVVSTLNQFKNHRRMCNRTATNQQIECEICGKLCQSLKGYTIHKLFHDTRRIARDGLNVFKGSAICELCGKEFNSSSGYRMHRRNVHRVGYGDETFECKICPKTCPTRRSLFDHMRNTHRVQETPCQVCGKVFRTKILLKKHMMYHDESKRIYFCNLCPDKPGYFTNVALKRHQKSHQNQKTSESKRDYQCEECDEVFSKYNALRNHTAQQHGYEKVEFTVKN